jgi:excinuclease ABC subunit A
MRFNRETLEHKGKSISDVLNMTIDDAKFLWIDPKNTQKIKTIKDVGLGYITLGQSTYHTFWYEAQRIKLHQNCLKETQEIRFIF